jgi:hypothetical protein
MSGFFGLGGGDGEDGSTLDEFGEPPRGQFGRMKYATARRARQVASDLGLSGIHQHTMNGQTLYMPGKDHEKLNKQLRKRGLAETPMPTSDRGAMDESGESGMMPLGGSSEDDDSALNPFGSTGEESRGDPLGPIFETDDEDGGLY